MDIKKAKKPAGASAGQDYVFALDIGTRSVMGVVGRQEGAFFNVIDTELLEHPTRAMMDGQIEDIGQVAHIATLVKQRLEQRLGTELKRVCVAAAGRSLKTGRASFKLEFASPETITESIVYELELGAVTAAREKLNEENEAARYYCVGHAVVRYILDDYPFTTVLNHRGTVVSVEVIATFLPNEVVDSLCETMNMVGLEIGHLTLEPIAAMNAVIPQELRLLNLALVDIGAGTSDIATSENGGVSAYTMATVAGDEVTEEIIRKCLVDFSTAERIKHEAARGVEEISYRDILGFEYTIGLEEALDILRPAVVSLAATICEKIIEVNGKPPMAVFLVGGGSKVPLLCDIVADDLKIDHKKVAVGGNNFIGRVVRTELDLTGPEYATPIGIAMTGAEYGMRDGFYVYINEEKTRLFRNYNVTVMDALLACGYHYSQLMGKCGKSLSYTLNGSKTVLRGGTYKPAEVTINGARAGISSGVECGDKIEISLAEEGCDAHLCAGDIASPLCDIHIALDSVLMDAGCHVSINGETVTAEREIAEGDEVSVFAVNTLGDLCAQMDMDAAMYMFLVNGEAQGSAYRLKNGDVVATVLRSEEPDGGALWEADAAGENDTDGEPEDTDESDDTDDMDDTDDSNDAGGGYVPNDGRGVVVAQAAQNVQNAQNPQSAAPPAQSADIYDTGEPAEDVEMQNPINVRLNGSMVELAPKEVGLPYQFIDMLTIVDIDPKKPQGNIVLRLNGRPASYLEPIKEGDSVDIFWEGARA